MRSSMQASLWEELELDSLLCAKRLLRTEEPMTNDTAETVLVLIRAATAALEAERTASKD